MSNKQLYFISFFMFLLILIPLSFADTVTYKYDDAGRLTEAKYEDKTIKYTYDAAGNMLRRAVQTVLPENVHPTGASSDLTGIPQVNTPITITVSAQGTGTINYRFYVGSQYGAPWTEVQPWSANNSCTYTPTSEGNYVFVGHITDNPGSGGVHQAGFSCATSGHSEAGVVIYNLSTNIGFPHNVGTPINLTAQAYATGTIYYKFWYKDDTGWHVLQEWSENNGANWTPTQAGTYIIVVWANTTADDNIPNRPIAGFTFTVGG